MSTTEPTRILIPSGLGNLGIEFREDGTVTRVIIVPKGRQRKLFTPYANLKPAERSETLDEILGRFSEYLAGARQKLDLPYELVDADELDHFGRRVLKETARIPYGRTRTHQQIASGAGRSDGYRLVLSTLMVNPLPLVIPCHRVVPSKGGVGSYIAGPKKKKWLLNMEERSRRSLS